MKVKPLLEKLTDKWYVKAASIIAACFLYIFNQYNSLEQKSVPVTLSVFQDGEMICTTQIPSSVSVTVRTSSENISQVSAEGITANLNLNYYTHEGNFDAPVYVDLPFALKSLDPLQVTVFPEKIKVHLEKNVSRAVKVEPLMAGKCPYGYAVVNLTCEPPYAEIFGPRSIVESIDSLQTQAIVVDEKTSTFTELKNLITHDRLVRFSGGEQVEVRAEIAYAQGMRAFEKFPVEMKNLNSDFETEGEFFADFSISGAQLNLDEYEPLSDIIYADLAEVSEEGEYELPVAVLLPPEFRLEKISVESVKVKVRKKIPLILEDESEK